ncbi:hypothetical protein P7C70_g7171, partial [Phenoliferia sp. Uapishka_3]
IIPADVAREEGVGLVYFSNRLLATQIFDYAALIGLSRYYARSYVRLTQHKPLKNNSWSTSIIPADEIALLYRKTRFTDSVVSLGDPLRPTHSPQDFFDVETFAGVSLAGFYTKDSLLEAVGVDYDPVSLGSAFWFWVFAVRSRHRTRVEGGFIDAGDEGWEDYRLRLYKAVSAHSVAVSSGLPADRMRPDNRLRDSLGATPALVNFVRARTPSLRLWGNIELGTDTLTVNRELPDMDLSLWQASSIPYPYETVAGTPLLDLPEEHPTYANDIFLVDLTATIVELLNSDFVAAAGADYFHCRRWLTMLESGGEELETWQQANWAKEEAIEKKGWPRWSTPPTRRVRCPAMSGPSDDRPKSTTFRRMPGVLEPRPGPPRPHLTHPPLVPNPRTITNRARIFPPPHPTSDRGVQGASTAAPLRLASDDSDGTRSIAETEVDEKEDAVPVGRQLKRRHNNSSPGPLPRLPPRSPLDNNDTLSPSILLPAPGCLHRVVEKTSTPRAPTSGSSSTASLRRTGEWVRIRPKRTCEAFRKSTGVDPLAPREVWVEFDDDNSDMYIQHSSHYLEIVSSPPSTPPRLRTPRLDRTPAPSEAEEDSDDELPTIDEIFAQAAQARDLELALNVAKNKGNGAIAGTPPAMVKRAIKRSPKQTPKPKKHQLPPSSPLRRAKAVYTVKKRPKHFERTVVKSRWSPRITPKAKPGAPLNFRGAMAGAWNEPNFIRRRELDAGRGWALDAHPAHVGQKGARFKPSRQRVLQQQMDLPTKTATAIKPSSLRVSQQQLDLPTKTAVPSGSPSITPTPGRPTRSHRSMVANPARRGQVPLLPSTARAGECDDRKAVSGTLILTRISGAAEVIVNHLAFRKWGAWAPATVATLARYVGDMGNIRNAGTVRALEVDVVLRL